MQADSRSELIQIRTTPAIKAAVQAAADKDRRKVSEWGHLLLERVLGEQVQDKRGAPADGDSRVA